MKRILFALLFITIAFSQIDNTIAGWYNDNYYVPAGSVYTEGLIVVDESTLAAESLNEPDFATQTKWTEAGDFTEHANVDYDYSHSTGIGSLTQIQGNLAIAGVGDRWYKFTYTISAETSFAGGMTITTGFASSAVSLNVVDGTHTVYFKSKTTPVDFVLSATSTAGDFTIDDVTLKRITGGDITAFGNILGYGTFGLGSGTTIDEFSVDGTLAGDSDDAVPTEKAVKAYADAITAALHDPVTLNASATTGGLGLSTQEITNRAATNAQTGYATAAQVIAQEANTTHSGSDGKDHSDVVTNNDKVTTQWTTSGNDIYYNTGKVIIGADGSPNATLEVKGPNPSPVGGFAAGIFQVTGESAARYIPAIITGHNSYNTNTQLWYLGSHSSSEDDVCFMNRQNAALSFHTNNIKRLSISASGSINILTNNIIGSGLWQAGIIPFAKGGTGFSNWTEFLIPYASSITSMGQIAIGTSGQVLTSAGAGVAPSFQAAAVVGTHPIATIYVPSSDQARLDDSAITIANTIVRVVGDGAPVLLDQAPSISDGAADGQMVVIQGTHDTNTVTIADNTNCQLAGGVNMTLGKGDTIQLIWDSGDSDWYELTRSDN